MCIAIVKPVDASISEETLQACFENNPDGCGFAYINTDSFGVRRIKVKKSMDFKGFLKKYVKALDKNPESPFLIHFRIKTHGKTNIDNCHPFMVDKGHVFIHNGIISAVRKDDTMSDTRVFNQDVLRILPKGWNQNTGIKALIEDFIGMSKLAVMNVNGDINIYNESKGEWKDGVWYSNSYGYKKKKVTYTQTTTYTVPATTTTHTKPYTPKMSSIDRIYSRTKKADYIRKDWDEKSYIQCDMCGIYHAITSMDAYWTGKDVVCFCRKCSFHEDMWYYFDPEDQVSTKAHIDWLHGLTRDIDTAVYDVPMKWKNPWGDIAEDGQLSAEDAAYLEAIANEDPYGDIRWYDRP